MNTDVKVGLAIGLVLLVGLFVWLAIVSSGKPTPDTGLPGREADRVAPATTASRHQPAATSPADTRPGPVTVEIGTPRETTTPGTVPSTAADDLTPEALKYLELLRETPTDTVAMLPETSSPAVTVTPSDTTPLIATPATYIVKRGDTLSTISVQVYGTSRFWNRIARENDIDDPGMLRVGSVLKIPPLADGERIYTAGVAPPASGQQTHKVEEGETLSEISQKYYGTIRHVRRIMAANNLDDENLLRVGRLLVIPKLTETPTAVGVPASVPVTPRAPGQYIVREGDTLTSIAQQFYGSTRFYTLIMRANGIDFPEAVRPGQKLVIPPKPTGEPAPGRDTLDPRLDPGEREYTVQEGDTLTDIASREMGSSREYLRLMQRNNITDASLLRVGQVIVIPARGALRMLSTEARER